MPHAMLLQGSEGSGALPLAIALAQYIDCQGDKSNGDACGTCPSCKKIAKLVHPDVHCVFPIVKLSTSDDSDTYLPEWRKMFEDRVYFGLDEWVDAMESHSASAAGPADGKAPTGKQALIAKDAAVTIHSKLSLKPYEAQKQILILWKPELMNDATSNSLLKILEEPPTDTIFILVSEDPSVILPTILSRTQVFKVPPIDEDDMAKALAGQMSQDEATRIAHIAQGNYVAALKMIRGAEDLKVYFDVFKEMMRAAYSRNVVKMNRISDTFRAMSREQAKACLLYCQHMIRESFIMNLAQPRLNFLTAEEEEFLANFAPFVHVGNVEKLACLLDDTIAKVEQNGSLKMVTKTMVLQLTALIRNNKRPSAANA